MVNDNELILIPRLLSVQVSGTQLESDLKKLTANVNVNGGLKLQVSLDLSKTKQIEDQLKNITSVNNTVAVGIVTDVKDISREVKSGLNEAQKIIDSNPVEVKVNVDKEKSTVVKDIITQYKKLEVQTENLNAAEKQGFSTDSIQIYKSAIEELEQNIGSLKQRLNDLGGASAVQLAEIQAAMPKEGFVDQEKLVDGILSRLKDLQQGYKDLANASVQGLDNNTLKIYEGSIEDISADIVNLKGHLQQIGATNEQWARITTAENSVLPFTKKDLEAIGKSIDDIAKKLSKISAPKVLESKQFKDTEVKIEAITTALDNLGKVDSMTEQVLAAKQLGEEVKIAEIAVNDLFAQNKEENNVEKVNKDVKVLLTHIEKIKTTWSAAMSNEQFVARIQQIEDKLNDVNGDAMKLQSVRKEYQELANNISSAELNQRSFMDRIAETGTKLAGYLINMMSYTAILGSLKNGLQAVKELDLSLTEIRKVSDLSGESLNKFVDKSFEVASQIGRTGKDLVDATAEFVRAGYTLDNAFEMGRASLIMTNVGDGIESVEEASSALIAVLRGFKLSETGIMGVVDAINQVSNTAPITFADLTEGLRRVSGTLSQTGADLSQTMGLLTGGFAQLRDIEGVSAGLVMISQRLRGIGEDGEAIEGLAPKLQSAFKEIAGIDISDGEGSLRSTYDILEDMARIFPTLSDMQRQYLSELAAGNRQVKVLNSILSGWEDVEKAVASALDSENSALVENEKFMDSIEGKTQNLSSSFQKMANTLIDSGIVKSVLDLANAGINIVSAWDGIPAKIIAVVAAFTTLNATVKTIGTTNFGKNFIEFFKDIGGCKLLHSFGRLPHVS